jgi:hypothetical protein
MEESALRLTSYRNLQKLRAKEHSGRKEAMSGVASRSLSPPRS